MVTVEELEKEIADLAAHLDAATHRMLECIRLFDEAGEWHRQGAMSCAHWLSWRIGVDLGTARERVRVARALGKLRAIDEALRVGKLSYAKARALTRVATAETEGKLLEMGLVATGAQLEKLCRGYRRAIAPDEGPQPEERSVRSRVLPGGMVRLEMVLNPDEADLVMRAVDQARELEHEAAKAAPAGPDQSSAEMSEAPSAPAQPTPKAALPCHCDEDGMAQPGPGWPSRADGMVALAESFLAGHSASGNGGERFQVVVHVDQDPLRADGVFAATLEDGTRLAAEAFRRVACDCGLVAVSGQGEQLNIGRRSRAIPPAIRRALAVRDGGCRFPGCTNHRFLHAHHLEHWLHGGETSLENLIYVCPVHHGLLHEGGWTVSRAEDGNIAFHAPDRRALERRQASRCDTDILGRLHEWAIEHEVNVGPDSNMPTWDGTRPDYHWAVAALVKAN